jgi:hypothetical protein
MPTKAKSKSFFALSKLEKVAVVARLAKGTDFNQTRPLSAEESALWKIAKRGRPRKRPGTKAVAVQVTFAPEFLKEIDAFAAARKMSRAQLLACGAKLAMAR